MKFRSPFRRSKAARGETLPVDGGPIGRRLVIHAGFAKCGSSSVQGTLFQNFGKLQEDGVYLFDKNLRIAKDAVDLGTPLWALEDARKKGEQLTEKLADEIASLVGRNRRCVAVLSAENLANPGMAELFAGLDRQFEVSLVFYLRTQLEWIPSAWKQWGLGKGQPLDAFVAHCLAVRRPAFRRDIEVWQRLLPAARLNVQFLVPELLKERDPARDFLGLLGLAPDRYEIGNDRRNPSLDFSVLHVLSKNPQLFREGDRNQLIRALRSAMSKQFLSTNIRMLSSEQEAQIEHCFREENLWLLRTYGGGIDVDEIYRRHFTPQKVETRYSDTSELDLLYRCLGIALDSIANLSKELKMADRGRADAIEPEE
jgi:hypothetical protein